jgi:hypothetical protein
VKTAESRRYTVLRRLSGRELDANVPEHDY